MKERRQRNVFSKKAALHFGKKGIFLIHSFILCNKLITCGNGSFGWTFAEFDFVFASIFNRNILARLGVHVHCRHRCYSN